MVGSALVRAGLEAGYRVASAGRRLGVGAHVSVLWDVSMQDAPRELLAWQPDVVIHAAAWTAVDGCEDDPDRAFATNRDGTARAARLACATGARLIYLSTDSVFDGRRGGYADTDEPHPLNVYAASKRAGEIAALDAPRALVVRFNVVGPDRMAWWMLDSAAKGMPIPVYTDVRFSPLDVRDLATALVALMSTPMEGVCHLASDEVLSKAQFAERLIAAAGLSSSCALLPTRLADRQKRAVRPLDTSLRVSSRVLPMVSVPALQQAIERLAAEFTASHGAEPRSVPS